MIELFTRTYPKTGVHGRVVHGIGGDIVSGIYKPGNKLPSETEFNHQYRGSRTVIREAFRVLSAKGLLVARQRSGTSVRCKKYWNLLDPDILAWQSPGNIGLEAMKNMLEVRECVEPMVARLVSERASLKEIINLEEICRLMERAESEGQSERLLELELCFHNALFECCHNDMLKRMRDIVQAVLRHSQFKKTACRELLPGMVQAHVSVLEKIRIRDEVGAESAARSLVNRTSRALLLKSEEANTLDHAVA